MKKEPIYYNCGNIKFTILIKNNKYHLDFYTPAGERKRKSTKKSVTPENLRHIKRVLIPHIILELGQEPILKNEKAEPTLEEYAIVFFELEKNRISEASLIVDKRWYYNHIYPYFGKRILSTIKKQDLDQWQNRLMNSISPKTNKLYKRGYVQNLRSVFNKILKAAVYDEVIEKNYFENIPTPRNLKNIDDTQKESTIIPFTHQQMVDILAKSEGYMRNFILLMVSTGMRPGEIIALTWDDIDFKRELIHVSKTRHNGKDKDPKTKASVRSVEIYTNAKNALKAQFELTKDEEKVFINELASDGKTKAFYSHASISKTFKTILQELGIADGFHLYCLRHTFASIMIPIPNINMMKISREMGHKDLSTTLKKYAKFIELDDKTRLEEKKKIDKFIDIL